MTRSLVTDRWVALGSAVLQHLLMLSPLPGTRPYL